jgi:hypothetical protein
MDDGVGWVVVWLVLLLFPSYCCKAPIHVLGVSHLGSLWGSREGSWQAQGFFLHAEALIIKGGVFFVAKSDLRHADQTEMK